MDDYLRQQSFYLNSILVQYKKSKFYLENILKYYDISCDDNLGANLLNCHSDLFDHLRSKIFPDNKINQFTEKFFLSLICNNKRVEFYVVLADITARKEINFFIRFLNFFKKFTDHIVVHFLFVNWPILKHYYKNANIDKINQTYNLINKIIKQKLSTFTLDISNFLATDFPLRYNNGFFNQIFQCELKSIELCICDERLNSRKFSLETDLKWITHFYAHQRSLSHLGYNQAIFDLALRRSIGAYIDFTIQQFSKQENACILLTSELNKRFLKCYDTKNFIINIALS